MKHWESIKTVSYLKTHASEIIYDVFENQKTIIITHHGEAKAVVQNLANYEQMNESIIMLKLLAQSTKSKLLGRYKPVKKAFSDLRVRIKELR